MKMHLPQLWSESFSVQGPSRTFKKPSGAKDLLLPMTKHPAVRTALAHSRAVIQPESWEHARGVYLVTQSWHPSVLSHDPQWFSCFLHQILQPQPSPWRILETFRHRSWSEAPWLSGRIRWPQRSRFWPTIGGFGAGSQNLGRNCWERRHKQYPSTVLCNVCPIVLSYYLLLSWHIHDISYGWYKASTIRSLSLGLRKCMHLVL